MDELVSQLYCSHLLLPGSFEDSNDEPGLAGMLDPGQETMLPQWMWISNVAIYSHKGLACLEQSSRPLWGWSEQEEAELQVRIFGGVCYDNAKPTACSQKRLPSSVSDLTFRYSTEISGWTTFQHREREVWESLTCFLS
jgi:hypothetical protein